MPVTQQFDASGAANTRVSRTRDVKINEEVFLVNSKSDVGATKTGQHWIYGIYFIFGKFPYTVNFPRSSNTVHGSRATWFNVDVT